MVTDTNCPTVISNNFIDWTPANGASNNSSGAGNDCVRITAELGSVSNVTVKNNYLIGGTSVIDAGNAGTAGTFSNIDITNNMIGFGACWDIMPGAHSGVTLSGNTTFDWTNPSYASKAWTAYEAKGVETANLVVATRAGEDIAAPATGSTTLYGGGMVDHLFGGAHENVLVGGFGVQYFWGGTGKNVFTYLSVSDSTPTTGEDALGNFHVSQDVIDLSHINANPASSTIQNFAFTGTAPLTSAGGQVDYYHKLSLNETFVQVSLVGDASADMVIRVGGLLNLTAANFALTAAQSAAV